MFEKLESKNICLRKAKENDWRSMLENVWGDEAVYQWMLYQPTLTEEDAVDRCRRSMLYQENNFAWFVALKDTDEAIGLCAMKEDEPGHFEESGICIGEKYQGKGYGKEILALLLELAFEKLGAEDFRYGYFQDNFRSKKLAEVFHFRYDHSYELTRPWDSARKIIDSCILTKEDYFMVCKMTGDESRKTDGDAAVISAAGEYIVEIFKDNADGHDAGHSVRVFHNALLIAAEYPDSDHTVISLAALLHDVDDHKLFQTENNANARSFLTKHGIGREQTEQICEIINSVSFSKNRGRRPATLEGMIVQDADRLDAIGAVGIARTFAYGGKHGRPLESSVQHFYDKLLLLKAEMNTQKAKEIADVRHAFMEVFLKEFDSETRQEETDNEL